MLARSVLLKLIRRGGSSKGEIAPLPISSVLESSNREVNSGGTNGVLVENGGIKGPSYVSTDSSKVLLSMCKAGGYAFRMEALVNWVLCAFETLDSDGLGRSNNPLGTKGLLFFFLYIVSGGRRQLGRSKWLRNEG